ncbi:MAG: C1 family peptidase [Planctomycetaceae bacterium]|nr:C1 family peptidase [Planctomycetaceae bacterium]
MANHLRWQRRFAGRLVAALILLATAPLPGRAALPETPDAQAGTDVDCVNLRPVFDELGVQLRPQGSRGTCSVFTVAGAIEYALGKSGKPGSCASVEFLNWASNQVTGEADDGSFFSDLWKGFEKYGVCDEKEMPYADKFDSERAPSETALEQAKQVHETDLRLHWIKPWDPNKGLNEEQFAAVKATLKKGWPVCGGFLWPKEAKWIDDVLQWAPHAGVRDGHSVMLYGYRDDPAQPGGGVFLIRNSSRGPRYGSMTYEYVRAYMNDAVWVESKAAAGSK